MSSTPKAHAFCMLTHRLTCTEQLTMSSVSLASYIQTRDLRWLRSEGSPTNRFSWTDGSTSKVDSSNSSILLGEFIHCSNNTFQVHSTASPFWFRQICSESVTILKRVTYHDIYPRSFDFSLKKQFSRLCGTRQKRHPQDICEWWRPYAHGNKSPEAES